jgi:hypothetical protein
LPRHVISTPALTVSLSLGSLGPAVHALQGEPQLLQCDADHLGRTAVQSRMERQGRSEYVVALLLAHFRKPA